MLPVYGSQRAARSVSGTIFATTGLETLKPLQNRVKMATICNLSKKSFKFEKNHWGMVV